MAKKLTELQQCKKLLEQALDSREDIEGYLCSEGTQWFSEVGKLLKSRESKCLNVEIVINFDSPFYSNEDLENAIHITSNNSKVKITNFEVINSEEI